VALENIDGNGNETNDIPSKYDIADVLLNYVYTLLPDEEELEDDDDVDDLISQALFICATAWNIAALPEDCADLYIGQVAAAYKDGDTPMLWDDLLEDLIAMSEDMKEQFPEGDYIITEHEMEPDEDGEMGFSISVMPVADAVAMIRESM